MEKNQVIEMKCDVLVVGGGIAGSVAALKALHHGLNVLLIEKEKSVAGKKAAESLMDDNNPLKYREWWNDSLYNSELMIKVFTRISKMDNGELLEHMEPFRGSIMAAWLKIMFSRRYRKYSDIYKGYRLLNKIGW